MSVPTPTETPIPAFTPLFILEPFAEGEEGVCVEKKIKLFESI